MTSYSTFHWLRSRNCLHRMRPASRPLSRPRPSATMTWSSQPTKGRDPAAESALHSPGKESSNPRLWNSFDVAYGIAWRRSDPTRMDMDQMDTARMDIKGVDITQRSDWGQ